MISHKTLEALDKRYLWHPFTQMKDWSAREIDIIEEGEGFFLKDISGRTYIDGVSSLWCNVHGHRKKEIDDAIRGQLDKIAHSTFLGLSNVPATFLAEKLIQIAPPGLSRVFYSDSGSEAMEIALKMAYQFWQQSGRPEKRKFVTLANAYHGDTVGSVSLGGIELFHEIYKPLLFQTYQVPSPYRYRWPGEKAFTYEEVKEKCLKLLEEVLRENGHEIAAFVMEPLMQGAAGMIDQPEGFISEARRLTKQYGVLLIFDEVATGFGRTGRMFASDHEGVTPDILAVAKGLTGGYLPLAATLTTEEVYGAFLGEYSEFKAFFHGHTYTGNQLASSAALANLALFGKENVIENMQPKIHWMRERLRGILELEHVGDVRQKGFMVGIELVKNKSTREEYPLAQRMGNLVCEEGKQLGIFCRPLGNVVVLMPAPAMDQQTLVTLVNGMAEAIVRATEKIPAESWVS